MQLRGEHRFEQTAPEVLDRGDLGRVDPPNIAPRSTNSQQEVLHLEVGEWHLERSRPTLSGRRGQHSDPVIGLGPLHQQVEIKIRKLAHRRLPSKLVQRTRKFSYGQMR